MDRKTLYFRGTIDDMLIELDSQKVDVKNYLDGSIADIILNKKQYKIFQIENIKELKSRILEIEKEHFVKEVLERYHSKDIKIENAVGGWKTINGEVDEEIEKILKSVIKKNKIKLFIIIYWIIYPLKPLYNIEMCYFKGISFSTLLNK